MMPARLRSLRSEGVHLPENRRGEIAAIWYDDEDWVVRYLSGRADGRSFVIPTPLVHVDEHYQFKVFTDTRELFPHNQIWSASQDGCTVSTEMSRAEECDLLQWYSLPAYWGGSGLWGDSLYPSELAAADEQRDPHHVLVHEERAEAHVHVAQDLIDDTVACPDGAYGWVDDLLIDLDNWSVKYLIVRALPAYAARDGSWDSHSAYNHATPRSRPAVNDALISPFWGMWRRADDQIRMPFTRSTIWASPAYKPDTLAPKDERILARYYGFVRNW